MVNINNLIIKVNTRFTLNFGSLATENPTASFKEKTLVVQISGRLSREKNCFQYPFRKFEFAKFSRKERNELGVARVQVSRFEMSVDQSFRDIFPHKVTTISNADDFSSGGARVAVSERKIVDIFKLCYDKKEKKEK